MNLLIGSDRLVVVDAWFISAEDIITIPQAINREKERRRGRRKGEEEEEEGGRRRRRRKEEEEGRKGRGRRMAASNPHCPHHSRGGEWICVESMFHEEMRSRLVESGNCLESLIRALDGDVDEQRALQNPIDVAAVRVPLERPPLTGWTCTPARIFISSNWNLASNTLALARRQLDWERALSVGRSVMPDATLESVSRNT